MPDRDFNTKRTWGPEPAYPKVQNWTKERSRECPYLAQKGPFPGRSAPIVIAGPCSIETPEQIRLIAQAISGKATFMRGGLFRAGTYPPTEFGLRKDLLVEWNHIAKGYGLRLIVEILDYRQIEEINPFCDAFQVGARAQQNYTLLKELSNQDKPVTLKRHPGCKLDELLGSCEYLLSGSGKVVPILIERGSVSHMNHCRWDLSVSLIAAVKRITNIPILVDASHGSGRRDLVEPLTLAGIAAGADGYLVEIHPHPEKSISDADQAISLEGFQNLHSRVEVLNALL